MPNGIGLFGVGVERCVSLLPRPALSVLFQSATKKHDNSQSAPCGGGGPCECMVVGFEAVRPNAFHTLGTGNFLQLEGSADADNPSIIPPAAVSAPMGEGHLSVVRSGRYGQRETFRGRAYRRPAAYGKPLRNTAMDWLVCCRRGGSA